MTAPMTILAAALDKVQHDPAACSLPARAQAERAAILVIAQAIEVEGEPAHHASSVLLPYVGEVTRAKEGLRVALEELDVDAPPDRRAVLVANFERAQDVYYQATASVAEIIGRIVNAPPVRRGESVDSDWSAGYV
ncbi:MULTISPECIES: hypothetical protein [Pseudomonas syringae group]|uniref:hypothetical protein n=1 Tax=Pseudomonas syringae group TaxID=136849 RepID=UPI000E312DA5|nr:MULTISPECIES: hypothetical protein [Pseudomonas syringae group]